MEIGYARVSTASQDAGFEAQVRDLNTAGVKRIFKERVSSVAYRAELERAIDFCHEDDVLVCTKIDRLARSIRDLCQIIDRLREKGATLKILNLGFDMNSPTGKLTLSILGSVAEFEREILLERQREGIAKAKADGKYRGRAPTARAKSTEAFALLETGMTREAVAKQLEIDVRSLYRILVDRKSNPNAALAAKPRVRPTPNAART